MRACRQESIHRSIHTSYVKPYISSLQCCDVPRLRFLGNLRLNLWDCGGPDLSNYFRGCRSAKPAKPVSVVHCFATCSRSSKPLNCSRRWALPLQSMMSASSTPWSAPKLGIPPGQDQFMENYFESQRENIFQHCEAGPGAAAAAGVL